ncbi:MAG: hypothetical protein WCY92_11575 [Novosphingobium sp.]
MVDNVLSEPQQSGYAERRAGFGTIVAVAIITFLLGAGLAVWAGSRGLVKFPLLNDATSSAAPEEAAQTAVEPAPEVSPGTAAKVEQAAQVVEKAAQQQGGFDQRLAALEQRLTRLDLQAQAASGNAARAEGLLIAFATRRALERGAPLGYLGDQLRLRFGDARPNAVRIIIEASRDPITLDQLVARLEGLSQDLTMAPKDEGVWPRIRRELDGLFVIRREASPSPAPRLRLERARMFLETGRVEAAVAEIRNMPGAARASSWIVEAERYAKVQSALELIETTAVLEPRKLRDGAGNQVEQLSPIATE